MKQGTATTYLHGDHLGSTNVASDVDGARVSRQTYYAFGAVRTSEGTLPTDYTFTGQKRDNEANLMFYNARYYVGITNNLARRMAEHTSARVWELTPIRGLDKLSRFDARAVEQVLIEAFKIENLQNRINSIARTNPVYEEAIRRRQELLANIHWHW